MSTDDPFQSASGDLSQAGATIRAAAVRLREVGADTIGYHNDLVHIANSFPGNAQQRYDQLNVSRRGAGRLVDKITAGRESLDQASQQLGRAQALIERAGAALSYAQISGGYDPARLDGMLNRLTALRAAAGEAAEHIEGADRRLDQVRGELVVIRDNDTVLNSAMSGETLSRRVVATQQQSAGDLRDVRGRLGAGVASVDGSDERINASITDTTLMSLEKGLNPTPADQQRPQDQAGERVGLHRADAREGDRERS